MWLLHFFQNEWIGEKIWPLAVLKKEKDLEGERPCKDVAAGCKQKVSVKIARGPITGITCKKKDENSEEKKSTYLLRTLPERR